MGAHELYSLASQHVPIQSINPTENGLDTKKQKAIVASYTLTQGIYESTEAYQQRLAQFRAELARKRLQFNKGADDGIYLVRQQMALTENKLAKLKTGENDNSTVQSPIRATSSYNFEYQNPGERDFLA